MLYLGTGTHGTTQHYIVSETHPLWSLHCALGSKPCGDMPSTRKIPQARDDASQLPLVQVAVRSTHTTTFLGIAENGILPNGQELLANYRN